MNLSERLAQAALDRRRQHEAATQRVEVTTVGAGSESVIDFHAAPSFVPERAAGPVDARDPEPMKMRFPEEPLAEASVAETGPLPLWQRPLADVLRDQPLATVLPLPVARIDHDAFDDDIDGGELAQPIPMRGEWVVPAVGIDRSELHVPPLATAEAAGLAGGSLHGEHDHALDHAHRADDEVIDLDELAIDAEIVDGTAVVNLDDVAVDAEIVDLSSADALLDRWSAGVSACAHDHQEMIDGLYQRMVDAAQQPRITFGPIDVRTGDPLSSAAAEHFCPLCGGSARVDIHDPVRGRIHVSCDSCHKMWQERVESTVDLDEPFMRD